MQSRIRRIIEKDGFAYQFDPMYHVHVHILAKRDRGRRAGKCLQRLKKYAFFVEKLESRTIGKSKAYRMELVRIARNITGYLAMHGMYRYSH